MKFTKTIAIAATLLSTVAHAQYWHGDLRGDSYNGYNEVRREASVTTGRVIDVRDVEINVPGNNSVAQLGGAAVGGTLGVVACSQGGGRSRGMVMGLCGLVGGVVGTVAGDHMTRDQRSGVEFMVETGRGDVISVTQERDHYARDILVGDKVRLVRSNNATRVIRINYDN